MYADELDADGLEAVSHGNDKSVIVALDVEHHTVAPDEAGTRVVVANVLRDSPRGMLGFVVLGLQGLFGVGMPFLKAPQRADGDNFHGVHDGPISGLVKRPEFRCISRWFSVEYFPSR